MALTKLTNKPAVRVHLGIINDLSQAYEFATLDDAINSTIVFPVGKVITLKERSTGNGGGAMWDVVLASGVVINNKNIVQCVGLPLLALVYRRVENDTLDVAAYGPVMDNSTDNTAVVQAAIDTLSPDPDFGGKVYIPRGCHFDLKALTFVKRQTLLYYTDDDTSDTVSSGLGTNELITFQANANNAGIVNEQRFTAPFHPGYVVDVRKDVLGHTSFLGSGQSQTEIARASYNIHDEQVGVFKMLYLNHDRQSRFAGTQVAGTITRYTLGNIKTSSFATPPVYGDIFTGNTSGARGYYFSDDGNETLLSWNTGEFVVGEAITKNSGTPEVPVNEVSSDTISTEVLNLLSSGGLGFSKDTGEVTVGDRINDTLGLFTIGGRSIVKQTSSFGQTVTETIVKPVRSWLDTVSETNVGMDVMLDKLNVANGARLVTTDFKDDTPKGMIGALSASTQLKSNLLVSTSSYNIASMVKNGTGDYTITYKNPLVRADYCSQLSVGYGQSALGDLIPQIFIQTESVIRIKCRSRSTGVALDVDGYTIHFSAFCGDR